MELERMIEHVLEQQVRPMLREHGGELRFLEYSEGTVVVELMGACSGCPSADLSTRGFIEDTLRAAIPEVRCVELSRTVSPDLLDIARKLLRHEEIL